MMARLKTTHCYGLFLPNGQSLKRRLATLFDGSRCFALAGRYISRRCERSQTGSYPSRSAHGLIVRNRFHPKSGQRHASRNLRAQPTKGTQYPRCREFRLDQRLGSAQDHEILERKAVFAALPARRGNEPRIDQSAHDGARESEQLADVAQ